MFKRSPCLGPLNAPNRFWNPSKIQNVLKTLSRMAGLSEEYNYMPYCDQSEITLNFALDPGGSDTQSIPSRAGYWIVLAKRASITLDGQQFRTPALARVASYVVSEESNTNVILIEDQPIINVFGSGEWQESQFLDYPANFNNRIFTVTNSSSSRMEISISFKTMRVLPEAFE